ncbi:MAG TPA: DUF4157 domain-containing protein [Myxococcota bacterium]|nr:DUF4157 domain-containing protein [Myxococcota bacterium]
MALGKRGDRWERDTVRFARGASGPVRRIGATDLPEGRVPLEVAQRIEARRGAGDPLPAAERAGYEKRLGHDFARIRVHADSHAASLNQALAARAFTVGDDVFLGSGTHRGVLAHELAHTLQQRDGPPVVQQYTDEEYEKEEEAIGISEHTLTPVAGVHGATFTADKCVGAMGAPREGEPGCSVSFKFEKAYAGDRPTRDGDTVRGAYVIIASSVTKSCGDCAEVRNVQVVRNIEKAHGHMVAMDPELDVRRARSGWGDPSAPSRGWRIDVPDEVKSPWFQRGTDTQFGGYGTSVGTTSTPARLRDSPADWPTDRNLGRELQTCAICYNAGKRALPIGCITWGYYIDGAGKIRFRPAKPIASCGMTKELIDSLLRWNAIPGNEKADIGF